jgi:asparagine synthase (glutamine-hydrolysing)
MPGIFGIIDTSGHVSAQRAGDLRAMAGRMSAAMKYEPFYVVDAVAAPDLGAWVGRVGFDDARPATPLSKPHSESYSEFQQILLTAGEPRCPANRSGEGKNGTCGIGYGAADLLSLYAAAGAEGLARVNGAFSGILLDRRNSQCLLWNDRYGVERLFLHRDGSVVLFASEAKAILAAAPRTRSFDPAGLADFLALGCTQGTRSLFAGIEVLEAGSIVTFSANSGSSNPEKRRRYFTAAALEQLPPSTEEQFLETFRACLEDAVGEAVSNPPPAGISLTGGLDSRMIMASLHAAPGSTPCYTFGSMYRTTYDLALSRQVAAVCRQPHHTLELDRPFLDEIGANLEKSVYICDGYLGLSGAAELYLNRRARFIAPARITGNWGGELLRGVRAFKCSLPKGNFVLPELAARMSESAEEFSKPSVTNPVSYALFCQMPVQGYGRYAIERSQMRMRAPFLANDVVASIFQAPANSDRAIARSREIIGQNPALLSIPTERGLLGNDSGFGTALRSAYRKVVIKAEYMTSHGASDLMAKVSSSLPSGLLETRFLGRDKFAHFRLWMRNEISGFVRETLLSRESSLSNWFETRKIEAMVNDHIGGRANYTDELDKLLTVAAACRSLLKAEPSLFSKIDAGVEPAAEVHSTAARS